MKNLLLVPLAALGLAMPVTAGDATPLFAKDSLAGWTAAGGKAPDAAAWTMVDGVLTRAKDKAGDLWSTGSYGDFELSFEWRVTEGANSGVKYRVLDKKGSALGFEYQVLDDAKHADGKKPTTSAAALYHVIPPGPAKQLKPVGEWNQARVVIRGRHIEHWLNGAIVVDVETTGPAWDAAVAASKYARQADYATQKTGPIVIQDHGDVVSFRNMLVKPL